MINQAKNTTSPLYVVFLLDSKYYGINIEYIYRVLRMDRFNKLEKNLPFVEGIVSFKGMPVPVFDIRRRFALRPARPTSESCIIIISFTGKYIGIVADAVVGVLPIPLTSIETPPYDSDKKYLQGIARLDTGYVMLPDMNKVFSKLPERMAFTLEKKQTAKSQIT